MIPQLSETEIKENTERIEYLSSIKKFTPKVLIHLIDMPFFELRIQDGPYCPNTCGHCYGDFGPHHSFKAPEKLYKTLMKAIPKTKIESYIDEINQEGKWEIFTKN